MKKLISLIGAGVLFFGGSAVAQENSSINSKEEYQKKAFSKLGIPERFVGYEKNLSRQCLIDIESTLYYLEEYDSNRDGKADVQEIYQVAYRDGNGVYHCIENAIVYGFDINGDNLFEGDGEIIRDREEDGWNGNEQVFHLPSMTGVI
jgi:hypothetical protein